MRTAILFCALVAAPAVGQTTTPPATSATPAQTTTPAPATGTPAPTTAAPSSTTPAPATAAPATSAAAQVKAGATVYDATGAQVGTVDQVNADVVIVNTGTNKVGVPLGNFAAGPNGPVLGNTKAQLDAAAAQSAAQAQTQLKSLLVAGASVKGTGGNVLGSVKTADDQYVTVTTDKGDVRLPITGFAAGPNGLVLGLTAAQFDAAVKGTVAEK